MRVVALVDGEHHPPVVRWGLASARAAGYEVAAALAVGGGEKLGPGGFDLGQVPVLPGEPDPDTALRAAIDALRPEAVLDLSDEPVLGYERRMSLAAVALSKGVSYIGPDFRFDPPVLDSPLPVSTLAVIGTGKRTGKTAVGGHVARLSASAGESPVVVAMGRGGPPSPVIAGPGDVTPSALLARADRGEHAASDFLEDALTAGVPTVAARRCGGGLAGKPFVTNVAAGAARAVAAGADLVILEGSGASVPTVPWDVGVLVVPGSLPPDQLGGHWTQLRVLLSDFAVFTIGQSAATRPNGLSTLESRIRRLRPDMRVTVAELKPVALADVRDKDVFFATTAHQDAARRLGNSLQASSGCRVVAVSARLADRDGLQSDLAGAPPFDALVTELKAAAVDVGVRWALRRGIDVVFVDNRPFPVGGDADVDDLLREAVAEARRRAAARAARV